MLDAAAGNMGKTQRDPVVHYFFRMMSWPNPCFTLQIKVNAIKQHMRQQMAEGKLERILWARLNRKLDVPPRAKAE